MENRSDAQSIEIFHLLFLQVLTAHSRDWFILKGGANLRYFFGSLRYSNDIDLDYYSKEGWHVERVTDAALTGRALGVLLDQQGLKIHELTKPKQTDTTRSWKLGLSSQSSPEKLIHTKIEFSNRGIQSNDVIYETIPNRIVDPYGLRPSSLSHYGQTAALEQKIAAIALRSETKARDIFDLELLFRARRATRSVSDIDITYAIEAALRAREVSFSSFQSEVIPFLDPDTASLFEGEESWGQMRDDVSAELDDLVTCNQEREP